MSPRKLVLFIAASLDGYIATEDHSLDWLFSVEGEGDNGISAFYDTVDTVVMGRITYEWIMAQEGDFPYKEKECFVFSKTRKVSPAHVSFARGDVAEFSQKLKNKDGKNIWILGGSGLLAAFLKEALVDEIIVTIAPVVLGRGIPLFAGQHSQMPLRLTSTNRFGQFVELRYDVMQPSS